MLRIYFLQQWFNLSDPAVEEALYDSLAMRGFVDIDLGREPVPDETTVCRFRHLLETHDLGRELFDEVQRHLAAKGLKVATGTIVDATIINAPSSTKNAKNARDPEMHQTKKGNQWYFGMKAHIGVDSRTKLIHAAVATPANVADAQGGQVPLHRPERAIPCDHRRARRALRAVPVGPGVQPGPRDGPSPQFPEHPFVGFPPNRCRDWLTSGATAESLPVEQATQYACREVVTVATGWTPAFCMSADAMRGASMPSSRKSATR
jgi:IS5 family transposase